MTFDELRERFSAATPETWHQHPNGNGWVENTARVDEQACVEGVVCEQATVEGRAWVAGVVRGTAALAGRVYVGPRHVVTGGRWEASPLYIQGTRDPVYFPEPGQLAIGCQTLPLAEWPERIEQLAVEFGYSAAQLEEYRTYLALAARWLAEHVNG